MTVRCIRRERHQMKMSSEETSEESDTDSDLSVNVNPTPPGETRDNVFLATAENGLELPRRRSRQEGPIAAIIDGSNVSNDADDFRQQPQRDQT